MGIEIRAQWAREVVKYFGVIHNSRDFELNEVRGRLMQWRLGDNDSWDKAPR